MKQLFTCASAWQVFFSASKAAYWRISACNACFFTNNARMKKFIFCASCAAVSILCFAYAASAAEAVACIGKVVPGARVAKLAALSPSGAQAVIEDLRVEKGDSVDKGAVVAVMSGAARAEAALKRAEAGSKAAKTASDLRVMRQKNLIADLKGSFEQNAKILNEKDPPRREREEIDYEQVSLARKIAQAEAMLPLVEANEAAVLEESRAAVEEAKKFYEAHFVRSPISGEVIECHVKVGEAPGMEGICEIVDSSEMYVDAEVYISDISKVKVGDAAEIFSDALGDEKCAGKVVQISSYVRANRMFSTNPSDFSNLRVVIAKIKLDNPSKFKNLIGSQVNVRILTK